MSRAGARVGVTIDTAPVRWWEVAIPGHRRGRALAVQGMILDRGTRGMVTNGSIQVDAPDALTDDVTLLARSLADAARHRHPGTFPSMLMRAEAGGPWSPDGRWSDETKAAARAMKDADRPGARVGRRRQSRGRRGGRLPVDPARQGTEEPGSGPGSSQSARGSRSATGGCCSGRGSRPNGRRGSRPRRTTCRALCREGRGPGHVASRPRSLRFPGLAPGAARTPTAGRPRPRGSRSGSRPRPGPAPWSRTAARRGRRGT